MAKLLHGLIVDAACEMSLEVGWSALTMGLLADRVGVSRQTIYNEMGSKGQLARLVVHEANARLLNLVGRVFDAVPGQASDEVPAGVRQLVGAIAADPLLTALVATVQGVDSGAFPMAHVEPQELVADLSDALDDALARNLSGVELDLTEAERSIASSALVRLVLCTVAQPGSSQAQAADDLAWVAARLLRPGDIKPIG